MGVVGTDPVACSSLRIAVTVVGEDVAHMSVLAGADLQGQDHKHSGLKFVTPAQRHNGTAAVILTQREQVYREAKRRNPKRWSQHTRNWKLKDEVWLNSERIQPEELKQAA